jgi:hypothetical protein
MSWHIARARRSPAHEVALVLGSKVEMGHDECGADDENIVCVREHDARDGQLQRSRALFRPGSCAHVLETVTHPDVYIYIYIYIYILHSLLAVLNHTRTHALTHTRTHKHANTHTHIHTHTHAHTRARAHTHTHTYIHAYKPDIETHQPRRPAWPCDGIAVKPPASIPQTSQPHGQKLSITLSLSKHVTGLKVPPHAAGSSGPQSLRKVMS